MVTDILGSVLDLSFDANGFAELATPTTMDLTDPFSDPPLFAVDLPLGLRLDMDMDAFTQMQTAANYYNPMMSFVDEEAHRKQLQQQLAQHQQQQQKLQQQQQKPPQHHHHQQSQQQQQIPGEFATPSSPLSEMMRLHFEAKQRDELNPTPAPAQQTVGFQPSPVAITTKDTTRHSRRQQNPNSRRQRARASTAPYSVPTTVPQQQQQQSQLAQTLPIQSAISAASVDHLYPQQQQQQQFFAPQPVQHQQQFAFSAQNAFFLPFDAIHPY